MVDSLTRSFIFTPNKHKTSHNQQIIQFIHTASQTHLRHLLKFHKNGEDKPQIRMQVKANKFVQLTK